MTYSIQLTTQARRPDGALYDVFRFVNTSFEFPSTTLYVPGGTTSTTIPVNIGSAGDSVANTMAVATQFLLESQIGIGPSTQVKIISESSEGTLVYPSDRKKVHIGLGPNGEKWASWKYSTAHEIGHTIQLDLFGALDSTYVEDPPGTNFCNCRHIATSAERAHCLQSREQQAAAQEEGWGQFIALDAMNDDTQDDGIFIYYKEFLWPNSGYEQIGEQLPPLRIAGRKTYKWMKTLCPQGGYYGTELDWMGFYYAVHSTSSNKFYFTQLRDTYLKACEPGTCADEEPT